MKIFNLWITRDTLVDFVSMSWEYIHTHTLGQNWNAVKYVLNKNNQKEYVSWSPIGATIIIESRCNNRCQYCIWHSKESDRPYWPIHLSYDDFVEIADVLAAQHVAHLLFCGTGEPLFNKNIFKMIQYAQKKKFTTSLMSNSSKQMTPLIDRIASSGIIRFLTSIDSGFSEEYETIRYGAKFETVIANLEKLSEEREKHKAKFKIVVDCMAMKSNYKSYCKLVEILASVGVDIMNLTYLQPAVSNEICSSNNMITSKDSEIINEIDCAIKLGKKKGIRVNPPELPNKSGKRSKCDVMWWKIMVNLPNDKIPEKKWIGNMSSHCMLSHLGEASSYGNLMSQDFNEVWNGPQIRQIRKKLLTQPPEICQKCPGL